MDVSSLGLGQHIQVKDIAIPEGATILDDGDEFVVSVIIPRSVSAAEGEEAAEQGEVEVVAKGKAKSEEG